VSDYELVYKLNVPDKSNFQNDVPYVTDNSNSGSIGDFSRIAYYMELEHPTFLSQWVWVSMDAFTTDASKIGVPTFSSGAIFQESVLNVDVYSNVQPLCAEGLEGNLEFWPTNYGRHNADNISGASGNVFDFGDRRHGGGGYGSMQIHVASLETTVFAFNNWNAANADMGIGNNPNGHPDWTHTGNSAQYTVKTLEVWVK
jgi:sialate O-acetylesterase